MTVWANDSIGESSNNSDESFALYIKLNGTRKTITLDGNFDEWDAPVFDIKDDNVMGFELDFIEYVTLDNPGLDPAGDDFGISVDAKEAVSFAVLAWATIKGLTNNVPGVTGAERPVIMGKIIPA